MKVKFGVKEIRWMDKEAFYAKEHSDNCGCIGEEYLDPYFCKCIVDWSNPNEWNKVDDN